VGACAEVFISVLQDYKDGKHISEDCCREVFWHKI